MCPAVPMMSGMLGGCPGNHGGCGERSGGARRQPRCQMAARSSLLRRPARPARRTSSVVAALAALAPRLVRLARHDYPDGLLAMAGTTTLAGRVAVVTGASSGIGRAVAEQLAAAGVRVVLAARRAERLAEAVAAIRAAGGEAEAAVTDLRDEAQVERLIDGAVARHGRLDALVNNAAVGHIRPVAEGRSAEWRAVLETNVLGTLVACRAALRHMLPRGAGDIVNMTSASAHEAWPYLAAYAASKAAVHTLSRALRAEVAAQGIRVMTIEVHNVATEVASNFHPALLPLATERWKELRPLNPHAPLLAPEDVAPAGALPLPQPPPPR